MRILVTGGAGYIGSHTSVELLNGGYDVSIIDNLSNSKPEVLNRISGITGRDLKFHECDLLDIEHLRRIIRHDEFDAVIHFAGLKAVGESVLEPQKYYENNVVGTLNLMRVMQEANIRRLIFSSSATVYGRSAQMPLHEHSSLSPENPYGRTKLVVEQFLGDLCNADRSWEIIALRYFNPVGAHSSGMIGEDPRGIPANLLPYITQVAIGRREYLSVFGSDYNTPDGTGVRDYIHVADLAKGHIAALQRSGAKDGLRVYNLGTGHGCSVFELIKAFESASGVSIPCKIVARRPGDVAQSYCDPGLALRELGWRAEMSIQDICRDAWTWQTLNPNGFEE